MYRIEKYWKHRGFRCVVLMTDLGHRCGYVGVEPHHPLYGKNYNDHVPALEKLWNEAKKGPIGKRGIIPVLFADMKSIKPELVFDVHGGLTYSSDSPESVYPVPTDAPTWWFGYDCGHLGDARDLSVVSKTVREIEEKYPIDGTVRDLDYCVKECNSLAEQFEKVRSYITF